MHRESPSPLVDRHVDDGDVLTLGGERIEVLHTPGHTPDSVCYRVAGAVLTGDTLMVGGSGRTDFPGADAGQQYDAVHGRLFTLPDDTVVWPGHDYHGKTSTTSARRSGPTRAMWGAAAPSTSTLMGSLGSAVPGEDSAVAAGQPVGLREPRRFTSRWSPTSRRCRLVSPERSRRRSRGRAAAAARRARAGGVRRRAGARQGRAARPADVLQRRLPKLAGYLGREVVVICRSGARSATAAAILRQAGFGHVRNLAGGMLEWNARRLPVEH